MFTNRPATTQKHGVQPGTPQETPESTDGITADVYHVRDRVQRKLLAETDGEDGVWIEDSRAREEGSAA